MVSRTSKQKSQSQKPSKAVKPSGAKGVRFAEVDLNEDTDMEDVGAGSDKDVSDKGEEETEEEEEEEGDPDEFIDVLDILDGRGEAENPDNIGEVERGSNGSRIMRENEESEGGEHEEHEGNEEDEDEDEEPSTGLGLDEFSVDEDEADPSALDHLGSFITNLDAGTKRKAPEDVDSAEVVGDDKRKRRRHLLKEQTQTGVESEFVAQAGVCVPHA